MPDTHGTRDKLPAFNDTAPTGPRLVARIPPRVRYD